MSKISRVGIMGLSAIVAVCILLAAPALSLPSNSVSNGPLNGPSNGNMPPQGFGADNQRGCMGALGGMPGGMAGGVPGGMPGGMGFGMPIMLLTDDLTEEELNNMTLSEIRDLQTQKMQEMDNMTLAEIKALRQQKMDEMDNMTLGELKEMRGGDAPCGIGMDQGPMMGGSGRRDGGRGMGQNDGNAPEFHMFAPLLLSDDLTEEELNNMTLSEIRDLQTQKMESMTLGELKELMKNRAEAFGTAPGAAPGEDMEQNGKNGGRF